MLYDFIVPVLYPYGLMELLMVGLLIIGAPAWVGSITGCVGVADGAF